MPKAEIIFMSIFQNESNIGVIQTFIFNFNVSIMDAIK